MTQLIWYSQNQIYLYVLWPCHFYFIFELQHKISFWYYTRKIMFEKRITGIEHNVFNFPHLIKPKPQSWDQLNTRRHFERMKEDTILSKRQDKALCMVRHCHGALKIVVTTENVGRRPTGLIRYAPSDRIAERKWG